MLATQKIDAYHTETQEDVTREAIAGHTFRAPSSMSRRCLPVTISITSKSS
jgi:hypothetical protein